jgi:DNA adenine methylase
MRTRSLFPYAGGKFYLMKDIKEIFDKSGKTVAIDVFGGSGKFLLNVAAKAKVYNDIDSRLVNLFKVAKERPEELTAWFRFPLHSRELFNSFRCSRESGDEVEEAAKTLYLYYSSFAAKGETFGYGAKPRKAIVPKIENALQRVSEMHEEIKLWTIEHLDFRELLRRYDSPDAFFYLDPPYHGRKFYRYNFVEKDFQDLARLLSSLKGRYLMNINSDEFVIDCFGEPSSARQYTSFCDNARATGKRGKRTELLYWN